MIYAYMYVYIYILVLYLEWIENQQYDPKLGPLQMFIMLAGGFSGCPLGLPAQWPPA